MAFISSRISRLVYSSLATAFLVCSCISCWSLALNWVSRSYSLPSEAVPGCPEAALPSRAGWVVMYAGLAYGRLLLLAWA